jgi:signal transduction histidine kinase/DNA-binding response OmpR family regulator/HAMP domain-containing protein
MVDRGHPERLSAQEVLKRLPLAPTLTITLIALTLILALIAAIGIGNIYAARQDYEDAIARSYELQASGSRLLAAGVIEETAFRNRGPDAAQARANAAQAFDAEARITQSLAQEDDESARLLRARIIAERQARDTAAAGRRQGRTQSTERDLAQSIFVARTANDDLVARQRVRRAAAREKASDRTRTAVITVLAAGGLALLGALALIVALIGSIRRPLDELVDATKELAAGDLSKRVDPSGPQELRELDTAFNSMAEQLQGARGRIEAEREKLVTTIESLGDALVVCEHDGTVSAVNPRATEIVPELEPGEPAGGTGSPLPPLGDALAGEVIVDREGRTLAITAAELGDGEDGGIVWTLRDVSERARLERVKSDFVATASHELRSPLTSIKGFVELLERSPSLGDRDREFVDVILKSTDRLVDLVNDLLDVTRLDAGKMEVHPRLFDLSEQVRDVAALMAPRIEEKEQRIELDLPPTLPRALADPVRVRQILINLVSNAHQYTDEGGTITVSADQDGPLLVLAVADTGRGITPDDIDRVFERFVRRDDGLGGTGLGLAIVKSLVELQGGSIDLASHPGEGTTFTVRLPAEPGRLDDSEPRRAIRGKRVLVVDDEREIAELIAADLEPYDIDAEIETRGELALERLRREHFDAVTLDILMDGKSGLDVLRELRADPALRKTPVVVVSVLSGHQALYGEWKVAKPIDPLQLADAIGSAVLAGRTRVLVVGRSVVRPDLEPALVQLGLDHEWVTSGAAAAQACKRRRYEVALVDAGMRSPQAALRSLDLRGRRLEQSVLLFFAGAEPEGLAVLGPRAVPIGEAASAVREALGRPLAESPPAGAPAE